MKSLMGMREHRRVVHRDPPENLTEEARAETEALENLTPEQEAALKRANREQVLEFGRWASRFFKPRVVGAMLHGWQVTNEPDKEGRIFLVGPAGPAEDLRVCLSGSTEADGKRWLHLSVSRMDGIPSWEDIKLVKTRFLGDDSVALMVFPPKAEWVNIHINVLHLWVCLDGRLTPDFRRDVGGSFKSI